jgi:methyl-accepting chemotaxis protein
MNTSMASLMESSRQMTGIVDVIRGIADRISLLSLNAAIEAARAGDAGRGFAVVADEISKLSEQTAESLAEISKLIASTDRDVGIGINGVEETVGLLRATIDNVNRITAGVEEIDRLMAEQVGINDVVNDHALEVRSRSDEIRISTTEQMIALSEVAKSVGTINELTQSNAEGATALAGLSRQVEASAEVLKKQIGSYRGDGAGA